MKDDTLDPSLTRHSPVDPSSTQHFPDVRDVSGQDRASCRAPPSGSTRRRRWAECVQRGRQSHPSEAVPPAETLSPRPEDPTCGRGRSNPSETLSGLTAWVGAPGRREFPPRPPPRVSFHSPVRVTGPETSYLVVSRSWCFWDPRVRLPRVGPFPRVAGSVPMSFLAPTSTPAPVRSSVVGSVPISFLGPTLPARTTRFRSWGRHPAPSTTSTDGTSPMWTTRLRVTRTHF